MLQSIRLTQDENAGGAFQSAFDKENAGSVMRKPGLSGTKPGLTPSRRALGNITNLKPAAAGATPQQDSLKKSSSVGKDGKGGGQDVKTPARRAFGDITNCAPQQGARGGGLEAPLSKPKPALTQRATPLTNSRPMSSNKSATVANQPEASHRGLGGIERLAGKGWREQEEERVELEEKLVSMRVKAAAMMVSRVPQGLQVYTDADSESDDDGRVVEREPLMPMRIARSHELQHSEDDDPLAALMTSTYSTLDFPVFEKEASLLDDLFLD